MEILHSNGIIKIYNKTKPLKNYTERKRKKKWRDLKKTTKFLQSFIQNSLVVRKLIVSSWT